MEIIVITFNGHSDSGHRFPVARTHGLSLSKLYPGRLAGHECY
jgi:hypothetical protein